MTILGQRPHRAEPAAAAADAQQVRFRLPGPGDIPESRGCAWAIASPNRCWCTRSMKGAAAARPGRRTARRGAAAQGHRAALPARAVGRTAATREPGAGAGAGAGPAGGRRTHQRARRVGAGIGAGPVRGTAARMVASPACSSATTWRWSTGWPTTSRCCATACVQEIGPRDAVLRNPQTEYTQRLVAAVPVPDPAEQRRRREAAAGLFESFRRAQPAQAGSLGSSPAGATCSSASSTARRYGVSPPGGGPITASMSCSLHDGVAVQRLDQRAREPRRDRRHQADPPTRDASASATAAPGSSVGAARRPRRRSASSRRIRGHRDRRCPSCGTSSTGAVAASVR